MIQIEKVVVYIVYRYTEPDNGGCCKKLIKMFFNEDKAKNLIEELNKKRSYYEEYDYETEEVEE